MSGAAGGPGLISGHPRAAALTGAIAIAFSGFIFRHSGVSAATGTFFRGFYALPWLAVLAYLESRSGRSMPLRAHVLAIIAGLCFGLDLMLWTHAIGAVGTGISTVLANLQVIIVGFATWAIFKERPSRLMLAALPVMLAGIVLISGAIGGGAYGANPPLGVALGLTAAFAWAAYLVITRHIASLAQRPATVLLEATVMVVVVAAIGGLITGDLDLVPSWPAHGWLVVYGLTSQVIAYLLISRSLPLLPAMLTSMILLAQPLGTVAIGMLFLGEAPSLVQLAGVALIIIGLVVANLSRRGKGPAPRPVQRETTAPRPVPTEAA